MQLVVVLHNVPSDAMTRPCRLPNHFHHKIKPGAAIVAEGQGGGASWGWPPFLCRYRPLRGERDRSTVEEVSWPRLTGRSRNPQANERKPDVMQSPNALMTRNHTMMDTTTIRVPRPRPIAIALGMYHSGKPV